MKRLSDDNEWEFKKDAFVPTVEKVPDYLKKNRVVVDWYSRIQSLKSTGQLQQTTKNKATLDKYHLSILDYNKLYFNLEQYKRERTWYNLNITKDGIKSVLADSSWYDLMIPNESLKLGTYQDVIRVNQIATELLKKYVEHYYNYCKREWTEPRLEYGRLDRGKSFPKDRNYQIIVDSAETGLVRQIEGITKKVETNNPYIKGIKDGGDLKAIRWNTHLYEPLFHVHGPGKITVIPVRLNESEFQFVEDLHDWCQKDKDADYLKDNQLNLL